MVNFTSILLFTSMYVLQELLCVVVTKMKYDESYSFDQAVSLPVVLFPLFNTKIKIVLYACLCYSLYPPEASGGYFGLTSATPPPPRVELFSALTL